MNKLLIISLSLLTYSAIAQSGSDTSYAAHLKNKEAQRKASVLKYAKETGIPVSGINYKGQSVFLHHIENGRPVYYKSKTSKTVKAK